MFRDAVTLIDETVDNLNLLAELFADEIGELKRGGVQTPELHRYREAHSCIAALLPRLQAARALQQPTHLNYAHGGQPHCLNCD